MQPSNCVNLFLSHTAKRRQNEHVSIFCGKFMHGFQRAQASCLLAVLPRRFPDIRNSFFGRIKDVTPERNVRAGIFVEGRMILVNGIAIDISGATQWFGGRRFMNELPAFNDNFEISAFKSAGMETVILPIAEFPFIKPCGRIGILKISCFRPPSGRLNSNGGQSSKHSLPRSFSTTSVVFQGECRFASNGSLFCPMTWVILLCSEPKTATH